MEMSQLWIFETPTSVTANISVSVTWNPRTFNSVNYGNFSLNLWILRADSTSDQVVYNHESFLLAYNHSVFDNQLYWIPTIAEIDVNVPEAGAHQLAWEQTRNNVGRSPSNTSFEGFSQGFGVKAPPSSSASLSSTSSLSSSSTSSSTPTSSPTASSPSIIPSPMPNTASSPGASHATILGLGIGMGILLLLCIAGAIWGAKKYRQIKQERLQVPPKTPLSMPPGFTVHGGELDGRLVSREQKPAELAGIVVEM